MELTAEIENAWGWVGIKPAKVVGDNSFGNLIIEDENGHYWRLCPEDLSCEVIAHNRRELDALSTGQDFVHDWYMKTLVAQARQLLGPLRPGYKYCLKVPAVLGGEYGGSNLATISLAGLVAASGHVAKQIRDLPDGTKVQLTITE